MESKYRERQKRYLVLAIVCFAVSLVLAAPLVFAQTTAPAMGAPPIVDLTQLGRVAGIATLVTMLLQGIKQLVPVSGWPARIMAFILAAAGIIMTAPAGQAPLVTAGAAITAALGAAGLHGLIKASSGTAGSGGAPTATS